MTTAVANMHHSTTLSLSLCLSSDNPSLYNHNGYASSEHASPQRKKAYSEKRHTRDKSRDQGDQSLNSRVLLPCRGEPGLATEESGDEEGEEGEEDALNSTHMFSLNSSAQLNADGSLRYSRDRHHTLPLTPIPKRKWPPQPLQHEEEDLARPPEDVPPLDLTALRTSQDSSNSFRPFTGTSRSYDTYRFPSEHRQLPPLKSLPESAKDTGL